MKLAHTHGPSSASATRYDAVIVGAGPAGSALAAWLAGQGWRVLLAERDRLPRHKVCGEFLSPEAQKSLRGQGLYEDIAALAPVSLNGAKLTAHSGRTLDIHMPGEAWGISRYALDGALAAAAEQRGAALWTGTTVTGWQPMDGGMVVQLRRRQDAGLTKADRSEISSVQARAVLMACGRHPLAGLLPNAAARRTHNPTRNYILSWLRKFVRPHFLPHLLGAREPALPQQRFNTSVGIKCHFANVSMPAQVELYLFAGGYIGINPVENGYANVCALASYSAFARAGRSPSAMIEAAAQWNPAFGERLRNAQALPDTQCSVAPVDTQRSASPWDNLPLLGDRAAMIPPLCGDGMAMALRSAELCGPLVDGYLRADFSWHELGKRYSRLWHREFDYRLRIGRWLETMLLSPATTDLLFRAGARLPALADYFVRATRGANT